MRPLWLSADQEAWQLLGRVRLLAGVRLVRVQRYWCHRCRRTYGASDRRWARYGRCGREVQRKALGLYLHVGGSLRGTAEWVRGELAPGSGREVPTGRERA